MQYIAFIHQEDNNYVAVAPDLNFTSSYSDTFENAVKNIIDAGELYCEDLKTLPKPSILKELLNRKDLKVEKGAVPQLINIKVDKRVRYIM